MIADLQMIQAPLGGLTKISFNLYSLSLGNQPLGLLGNYEYRPMAIFANAYTSELRKFVKRFDLVYGFYGSKEFEKLLGVGYCRVILDDQFVRNLRNDSDACSKLRVELRKILSVESKWGVQ